MSTTRLDNATIPPALRNLDEDGIVQIYMRQVLSNMVDNEKFPQASEISEFFPLVGKAIKSKQRTENIPDDKQILFVEEDPPDRLDTEAITFYIQSRSPGQWSRGPVGENRHREVRFHTRAIQEHPEHPSEKLVTSGKFYDNYIRFNVYARTNKEARKRLLWFTQLMDQYLWYFRLSGFLVVEHAVEERQRVEIPEYGTVTVYPVIFFVKSEDIYYSGTQELKQVALSLDLERS